MPDTTRISILLAVYNGADWISDAIESVRAQSRADWELIVVDNGSTDATREVVGALADKDTRVTLVILTEKGKNRAYNAAFAKSTAELITIFAADDLLTRQSLERRCGPFNSVSPPSYTTCVLETMSDDPRYDGLKMPRDPQTPNLSGGALMFTREMGAKIFPLPEHLPNEDTWMQLHLRAFGRGIVVPEALYRYRIHGQNSFGYSLSHAEKKKRFLDRMEAYDLFMDKHRHVTNNETIDRDIAPFRRALEHFRRGEVSKIVFDRALSTKAKLLLVYYSVPFLSRVRAVFFRLLSGRIGQV